ncbi:AcrR family transcriptional regulator [Paenibacillus phyllosphaerae]|uniref:AcrR family transcriptional regulator n=1 Tax=Paenibacillus phyllosphaerae TaxID=274593 RepID=A0A7W5AVZ9_9BACL|nr:TetR/AcrR family transcriptional regulator [Paenibacillus phyllosphaerae]MBB3109733.1 AcrR family transcriptional regulator [Paenibacillus phyllosphaerae]
MSKKDNNEHDPFSSLPPGIALSWGLGKESQRGPKRELTIPQIVAAAVAIADRDGLAAVSMSRVAASLGFTAMSLYRYIPSKEDLLILMQDAICDIPLPEKASYADWRALLRDFAKANKQVFRDHPWFCDVPISGVPITPNNLRFVDWGLSALQHSGLNEAEQISIILLLSSYARSFGILERDFDRAMQAGASPDQFTGQGFTAALQQLVTAERYPHLYPLIMSGVYTGEGHQDDILDDDFEFGIERILDGIEHYLDTKRKGGQSS